MATLDPTNFGFSPRSLLMHSIRSSQSPLFNRHQALASPADLIPSSSSSALAPREYLGPIPARPSTTLQFLDLPLEIRDLIWVFALPDSRLFHVHQIHTSRRLGLRPDEDPQQRTPSLGRLRFYRTHSPPVVTQVCGESRRAAVRAGCFLLPALRKVDQGSVAGDGRRTAAAAATAAGAVTRMGSADPQRSGIWFDVWFNPRADILYLDRNQRAALTLTPDGAAELIIPGLEHIQHVGLEWRSLLRDGSAVLAEYSSPRMRPYWKHKIECLYAYFPALTAVHYILPMVRHQGGYPWGREPTGFKFLAAHLVDLPPGTVIPIDSGHRPWRAVLQELERTFRAAGEVGQGVDMGVGGRFPFEVVGHWLSREGLPEKFESTSIKVFDW